MLRKIFIDANFPRDISNFNGSFGEGLFFTRIFGYLFFILGIVLFLICVFKYKNYLLGMLFLGLCIYGTYLVNYTSQLTKKRQEIYVNGGMVRAKVLKHDSRFHPLKLTTEYILILENQANKEKIKVAHTIKGMHKSAPIGSETEGILYEGEYFFGESIGGQFDTHKIIN